MARMNGGRRGNKVSLGGGGSAEGGCQTKGGSDMVPRARRSSSQVACLESFACFWPPSL